MICDLILVGMALLTVLSMVPAKLYVMVDTRR